jgi:hypothetical protein
MEKFAAGDIYHSESAWTNQSLPITTLKEILSWNDNQPLNDMECLDLYNRWLAPIWNTLCAVSSNSTMRQAQSANGVMFRSKGELLEVFWAIHECLAVPELNFGIILKTPNRHK